MKKRYDFIVEQRDDLVNAKDSLLKTIEEVELTANKKFLDTFHLVRENFQKVLKHCLLKINGLFGKSRILLNWN
jgi:chromosome segregation protein